MAKRIKKITYEDGRSQYLIQTDRYFFGLLKCDWYTMEEDILCSDMMTVLHEPLVFDTEEEARKYLGWNTEKIKEEIIEVHED